MSRHVRHVLWQGHGAGARVLEVLGQTLARVTSLHALLFGMKIIFLILQKRFWLNNVYDKILYKLIPEEISYAEAEYIQLEKYSEMGEGEVVAHVCCCCCCCCRCCCCCDDH